MTGSRINILDFPHFSYEKCTFIPDIANLRYGIFTYRIIQSTSLLPPKQVLCNSHHPIVIENGLTTDQKRTCNGGKVKVELWLM